MWVCQLDKCPLHLDFELILPYIIKVVKGTTHMSDSNLSRTKPALRTSGAITGNFGHAKTRIGANNEIGFGDVGSMPTIGQQLTLFLSIYPRMSVQWRRNMLPTLSGWAATLNRCPELKLTVSSYAL